MADLMEEVVDLYSRRIDNKSIELLREYGKVNDLNALPGEIRQVLSNLVTNAIEASKQGGKLRLRIRSGYGPQGKSRVAGVRITVADNGSGIPEEARKRLGELFFTTKGQAGTGLGLWVTKSIVKRYGGTMCLKSSTASAHGTVFHIFLPFELPTPQRTTKSDELMSDAAYKQTKIHRISDHPSHFENKGSVQHPSKDEFSHERSQDKLHG